MKTMFPGDARRAGDRDRELGYRSRAEAMVEQFGLDARREIEVGRREQLRGKRG